jgi:predicted O-methyltransferase YrrM
MTADVETYGRGVKVSPRRVMPHAHAGRNRADKLRSFAQINPRFVPHMLRTAMQTKAVSAVTDFHTHCRAKGFEFTYDGVSGNVPHIAPLLVDFAGQSESRIRYLEIGAFEGRNLAFLDWLLPDRLNVTTIDPWFNEETNPDGAYHGIEARYHANIARMNFPALKTCKTYSGVELPRLRAAGDRFDLIYVDGSHTALDVLIDLSYAAALLTPGGMMIIDDYWHDISDIGGPGVKQAVDQFTRVFGRYFSISAVYRQVVLIKTDELPR